MIIKVDHLMKSFGDNLVLKDVSFQVGEGEVVCIIGPSGSGKSTLLRCIAQLETNADIVQKLKKGQNLFIQAYNMAQNVMTLSLPLGDFAKAYDGPATDPKELEEKNKKLQGELERRANEQRQKLEGGKTQ